MSFKYIRIYKNFDVEEVQKKLLIYGDLSGNCAKCQEIDIKLDQAKCPKCGAEFQYIAFRNFASHVPKTYKLLEQRPGVVFVDHEDFKKALASKKAEEFLR